MYLVVKKVVSVFDFPVAFCGSWYYLSAGDSTRFQFQEDPKAEPMTQSIEIIHAAVELILKASILATRFTVMLSVFSTRIHVTRMSPQTRSLPNRVRKNVAKLANKGCGKNNLVRQSIQ
jgi:hypothetical protein